MKVFMKLHFADWSVFPAQICVSHGQQNHTVIYIADISN